MKMVFDGCGTKTARHLGGSTIQCSNNYTDVHSNLYALYPWFSDHTPRMGVEQTKQQDDG